MGRELCCLAIEEGRMAPVMAAIAARERGTESFLDRLWTSRRCAGPVEGWLIAEFRLRSLSRA